MFCLKTLLPRIRNLNIEVSFGATNIPDTLGIMHCVDKRHFTIRIVEGLNYMSLIRILCHEMVHVKQWVKGEIVVTEWDYYWKGRVFPDYFETDNPKAYMNDPCEQEAYKLDLKLADAFLKQEIV